MRDPEMKDNFPLVAFSYLVRRFKMCPRFCLVSSSLSNPRSSLSLNSIIPAKGLPPWYQDRGPGAEALCVRRSVVFVPGM